MTCMTRPAPPCVPCLRTGGQRGHHECNTVATTLMRTTPRKCCLILTVNSCRARSFEIVSCTKSQIVCSHTHTRCAGPIVPLCLLLMYGVTAGAAPASPAFTTTPAASPAPESPAFTTTLAASPGEDIGAEACRIGNSRSNLSRAGSGKQSSRAKCLRRGLPTDDCMA